MIAAIRVFCILPFVTGALDLTDGVGLLKTAGLPFESKIATDPQLNSQVRFWGAIWLGYGILLWRSSSRLRTELQVFQVLCAILGLSGLGRLASAIQYGSPGVPLTAAMLLEFGASAAAYRWHARTLRRPDSTDPRSEILP